MELTGQRHVTVLAGGPEASGLVRASSMAEVQGDKEPLAGRQLCWCRSRRSPGARHSPPHWAMALAEREQEEGVGGCSGRRCGVGLTSGLQLPEPLARLSPPWEQEPLPRQQVTAGHLT